MKGRISQLAIVLLLGHSGMAFSQEAGDSDQLGLESLTQSAISSYSGSYFADQSPVTAFDMVSLLPGFVFQEGDNARGFSGGGGNVLINGRRPSSKSTGLRMTLRRIPVSAVIRIDVIRGGAADIDMQGQSIVANIIRSETESTAGALEAITKLYENDRDGTTIRIEQSRQSAGFLIDAALELRKELDQNKAGSGVLSRVDSVGEIIEFGSFTADYWTTRIDGSAALEKETANGLLRANLALTKNEDNEGEFSRLRNKLGQESTDVLSRQRSRRRAELGGDYERAIGSRQGIQVLGLQSLEVGSDITSRERPSGRQDSAESTRSGETILRAAWANQISSAFKLEAGAEGAYNYLDSDSELFRDGVSVVLPAATILVEELRAELFSNVTMQTNEGFSLAFGLRAETSSITVSGGAQARNRFSFLKPRVVGAYSLGGGSRFRVGVERKVEQLDFDDFAAGSELASNSLNAGNPDLAPESAWEFELGYEMPLLSDGAINLAYRHSELADVVDIIPVSGFAAPGNIGDGKREEVVLSLTLPLDALLAGLGRIQFDGTWRDSEVRDPVTGERRGVSKENPFQAEVNYSREFPSLNSSLGLRGAFATKQTSYRLDQLITERNGAYWRVNWDWRARQGLLVRAQLENFTARQFTRSRSIYEGLRSSVRPSELESRYAILNPFLMLRVRWTF